MRSVIHALFHHKGFDKYFLNTSWLIGERMLRMVLVLFVGIYLARYLGPEQFGILSFAISFVSLFATFAKLGLDGIVPRNLIKYPIQCDEILGTAFALRIIGGLLLLVVTFCAIQLTESNSLTNYIVLIIAFGHLLQAFQVINYYFQSQVLGKLISLAGSISFCISSLVQLLLIWFQAPLISFALVFVLEQGLNGGFLCRYYVKLQTVHTHWKVCYSQAKKLLKDSWPLIISGLVVMLYMRIDQLMLKLMLGNKAVGLYAAAVRISEAWYFIPMILSQSLFPAIMNAKAISEDLYYYRLELLYKVMTWLAIIVALPTSFLGGWIITFLYGSEYIESGIVLSIHIWASIFVFQGVARTKWILAENKQKYQTIFVTSGAAINICLNYFLIPPFGGEGAAWATLISQFSVALLIPAFIRSTRISSYMLLKSFWPWQKMSKWR